MTSVQLWTDGSTHPKNPGDRGGWGIVLLYGGVIRIKNGTLSENPPYTNNMMETLAVVEGISLLRLSCNIVLHTDSSYVLTGIKKWQRRGKLHTTNFEIWKRFAFSMKGHTITPNQVLGHTGFIQNELAHKLAYYASKFGYIVDDYYKSLSEATEFIIAEVKRIQNK